MKQPFAVQLEQFHSCRVMEGKPSPHLKKVLKSYQLNAANTLSGPSSLLSRFENGGSGSAPCNGSAPSSNANSNSNAAPTSTLIIKNNHVDPNGVIHGHGAIISNAKFMEGKEGPRNQPRQSKSFEEDRPQTQPQNQTSRGSLQNFSRSYSCYSMSDCSSSSSTSSSSTAGSASASPVSNSGISGLDHHHQSPLLPQSPHPIPSDTKIKIENDGATRQSQCSSSSSSSSPPKKHILHRNTPAPLKEEEQQRSIQAALVLASGLQQKQAPSPNYFSKFHRGQGFVGRKQAPPILSSPDRVTTEKRDTLLEGELISCFIIGGEKRLCFPQILTTVLRPFNLPQINQVCDQLQIFCSRCSVEQLEVLKTSGVLPMSANACGLITKTDAERLVNALLHKNPPKSAMGGRLVTGSVAARSGAAASSPHNSNSFRVYHKCFGKGKGIVLFNLYERTDSLCIECVECHGLFSPARFVSHSHHRQEVRTCHWGFDSAKWRHYILLSKEEDPEKWAKNLAEFKTKFDHKRKESVVSSEESFVGEEHILNKRARYSPAVEPILSQSVLEPSSCLPKKRLSLQYSENDHSGYTNAEIDSVKKMLMSKLGSDGAEPVIQLLDKLSSKISNLEKICRIQALDQCMNKRFLGIAEPHQTGAERELQAKVNSMESELCSLKKQLLRRHEKEEEV